MDAFRFDGKRVLVLGGASGMGNAAARLADQQGGDVTVLDVKEPVVAVGSYAPIDLREESAIDAALDGLDGPFHALMSCSGVADGTPGLPQVNFIGQRHFIESAIDRGIVPDGGAIGMISSIGGSAWPDHLAVIQEFLDTPDFATATKWIEAHPERGDYTFSKQAMVVYCARRARALLPRNIRINCIAPGPTMTPLMEAHDDWQMFEQTYAAAMDRRGATPEEQAYPLLFLVSDAASHISGICLTVDYGFVTGGMVGVVESPLLPAFLPRSFLQT